VHKMLLILIALMPRAAAGAEDSVPVVSSGKIERMSNFPSKFVDVRNIDVWLPDGYDRTQRYRVLYMYLRFIVEELKPAIDHKFATRPGPGVTAHGTLGLDADYGVYQQFFDRMMRDKGYTDVNYASRVFPGAAHDEAAWAERLGIPLAFLVGPR
jgi:hypothetical protein